MPHWKVFSFANMAEYLEFLESHPHYIHLVDESELDVEPNWGHLQLLCTKKHRKFQNRPGCSRDEKFPNRKNLLEQDPVEIELNIGDCNPNRHSEFFELSEQPTPPVSLEDSKHLQTFTNNAEQIKPELISTANCNPSRQRTPTIADADNDPVPHSQKSVKREPPSTEIEVKSILKQQLKAKPIDNYSHRMQIPPTAVKTDRRRSDLKVTFGSEEVIYFETDFSYYYQ